LGLPIIEDFYAVGGTQVIRDADALNLVFAIADVVARPPGPRLTFQAPITEVQFLLSSDRYQGMPRGLSRARASRESRFLSLTLRGIRPSVENVLNMRRHSQGHNGHVQRMFNIPA
jgi:hypothetical protein